MRTTIAITPETRNRLQIEGKKGETYDQLLNRMLDEVTALRKRSGELEKQLAEFVTFEPIR